MPGFFVPIVLTRHNDPVVADNTTPVVTRRAERS